MDKQKIKAIKQAKILALIGATASVNCAFAETSAFDKFTNGNIIGDGSAQTNFVWTTDENGIPVLEGTSAETYDFGVKYNTDPAGTRRIDAANLTNGANIVTNFINLSYTPQSGAAIYNQEKDKTIDNITGDFIGNKLSSYKDKYTRSGGAIYNEGTINNITGDFVANSVFHTTPESLNDYKGGAIYNAGTIGKITGDFIGNFASTDGGAIYNSSKIGSITGSFIGNSANGDGGAIYNRSEANITGDLIGNSANGYGGAIYNSSSITLNANSQDVQITGNASGAGATKFEAIYNLFTINFEADGNYKIVVNDAINGANSPQLNISGTGVTEFNNKVSNQTVTVKNGGNLKLGSYIGETITTASGSTITTKNTIAQLSNSDVTVSSNAKLIIGANETGDENLNEVLFDENSALTIEHGGLVAFETGADLTLNGGLDLDLTGVAEMPTADNALLFMTFETEAEASAYFDVLIGMINADSFNLLGTGGGALADSDWGIRFSEDKKGIEAIPEPATLSLIGISGFLAMLLRRRFSY